MPSAHSKRVAPKKEDVAASDADTDVEDVDVDMEGGAKRSQRKTATKSSKGSKSGSKGKSSSTKVAKKPSAAASKSKTKSATKPAARSTKGGTKTVSEARYFKLMDAKTGLSRGRYTGATPKQAASKGYTKYVRTLLDQGLNPPKKSTIYLRESTRGSPRKIYGYEASRDALKTPQELKIKDGKTKKVKVITYNFRNRIKKVAVPEAVQMGGARPAKKAAKSTKSGSASKPKSRSTASDKKAPTKSVTRTSGSKKSTKTMKPKSKPKQASSSR